LKKYFQNILKESLGRRRIYKYRSKKFLMAASNLKLFGHAVAMSLIFWRVIEMIKLIVGEKGTGKTQKLMKMANDDVNECKGNVVFLQASHKHVLDLHHDVRLINAMDFNVDNIESFRGFLSGVVAGNYDIEKVYIDKLYRMMEINEDNIEKTFELLDELSKKHDIKFTVGLRYAEKDLPEKYKEMMI